MSILCRLAVIHNPSTKTDATATVRLARQQGVSLPAGTQPELAASLLEIARQQRAKRSARRVTRTIPTQSTLAIRLAEAKESRRAKVCEAVREARRGLYRTASNAGKYAPGSGHTTTVRIGTPGVRSDSSKVWGKKWSATASEHTYTVAADWIATVQDRDLAVCDGMLTLSASPILGHGPELYRAVWVEQGRGTALNQASGYIARIDDKTYHAATAKAALDGVQRKAGLKPARRKGTLDLDRCARRYGDLPVEIADSRAAGNCESGTLSWCHAVGIDPYGTATVAEVIAGYRLRPLPEVLTVVRRVVRDRANRQPLDTSMPSGPVSAFEQPGRIVFDAEGGWRIEPGAEPSAN